MACPEGAFLSALLWVALGSPALAAAPAPLLGPDGPFEIGTLTRAGPAQRGRERVLVDPQSGALWVEGLDLDVPGGGPSLDLRRTWDDSGWRFSWTDALIASPEGPIWRNGEEDRLLPPDGPQTPESLKSLDAIPEGSSFGGGLLTRTAEGWILKEAGEEHRFDDQGRLIRSTDAAGRGLTARWDSRGELQSLRADDGRTLTFSSAAPGRVSTVQGPAGQLLTYDFYEGQLQARADNQGARTRYLYDEAGRLSGILWPDASALTVQRDAAGRVTRLAGPGAASLRLDWVEGGLDITDALGRRWTVRREPGAVRVSDPGGRVAIARSTDGRLSGWVDPRGLETRLRRDPEGHIIAVEAPGSATWRLSWLGGALASLTDPSGATWRYARDLAGRLIGLTSPAGPGLSLERDREGQITAIRRGSANPTRFERDLAGQITAIIFPSGAVTRLRRDGSGRVSALVDPVGNELALRWEDDPEPRALSSRTGARWELQHDVRGQLSRVKLPDGTLLSFQRDGFGHLARISAGADREVSLGWRSDGALNRVVDAAGRTWGILYSAAARPVQLLRPAAPGVQFNHDPVGALIGVLSEDGQLAIERDPRGNPLQVGPFRYTWDAADRLLSVAGPGVQVALVRGGDGGVRELRVGAEAPLAVARDGAGRVAQVGEGARALTLTRDPGGAITAFKADDSPVIRLDRDDRGLIIRVAEGERERLALRDAEGRPMRWTLEDGRAMSVDRAAEGQVVLVRFPDGSLSHRSWPADGSRELLIEGAGGELVLDQRVRTDPLGRAMELLEPQLTRLHRDPLGLLVTAESPRGVWTRTPGIIEGGDGTSAVLDERGRPSSAVPPVGPTAWGVARAALRYSLDAEGRVASVSGEDGVQRITYDALCRPVRLSVEGESARIIRWDLLGRPTRVDHFGAGATQLRWGSDGLLSYSNAEDLVEVLGERAWGWTLAGANTQSLHADASGSPRAWFEEGQLYELIHWSPTGSSAQHLPMLGWRGTIVLGDGGPYLDGEGAWDPLSGTPLCPRWSSPGAIPPSDPAAWPSPDGQSSPPWDPGPWRAQTPWNQPLDLLISLGELSPLDEGAWLAGPPEPPPLPWLPAAAATPPPPLWPGWSALPLDLDPVTAQALWASVPTPRPLDTRSLLTALLMQELGDQPLLDPGLDPLSHRWWEDILIPGQLLGWHALLEP